MVARAGLSETVEALARHYGKVDPPPASDPFELIVYENCAYLVDDARRKATFAALKKRVGVRPRDLLAANPTELGEAIAGGGMLPAGRAEKLVRAATLADEVGAPLSAVVKRPITEARRILKRFPGIGEPGADRLLLLSGAQPVLGMDSNALRVLTRLGYAREQKNYGKQYREALAAVTPELPAGVRAVQRAYLLLRHHGQTLCKTNRPECQACPVRAKCPVGKASKPA